MRKLLFAVASIIIVAGAVYINGCKKTDITPSENKHSTVVTESYKVLSSDGHEIGINGKQTPETNLKTSVVCLPASGLLVFADSALSTPTGIQCGLTTEWTNNGGSCLQLFINGVPYMDGTSHYTLWAAATNTIVSEDSLIAGGVFAGAHFNNFIRTWCGADTSISSHFDSPIFNYVVPSWFICDPVPNHHHHGRK